ncbi:tetratricopeptide repeat protein [bacterium]|nr:tetratricopeptide repeat protein [bacterium]
MRSYDLASRCGDRLGLAINCNNIGDCYTTLGDLTRAEEYLTRYLEINEIIANRLGNGYAYYGLASLARKRGETDKTEDYYRRAIQIYDEVGSSRMVLDVKLSLATFYAETGREEEAEELFAEVHEVMDEKETVIYRLNALGLTARRRRFTVGERERIRTFLPR